MAEQIGDKPQVVDSAPDPVDATSIRYQIQAKTLAGGLYTVYILDADYVGESTILQADETLIRFQKGEEDGTYEGGVIPTTADLFIRDKEPLAVLFGGDDERFRAVVYKGEQLFMTGWLMPDFYERDPYNSVPATKLSIADGLHLLKDRSMQDVLEEAVSVGDRSVGTNLVVLEDGDNVLEPQHDWYRVRDILWALLPKGRAVERELQYQATVEAGDEVTTQLVGPASPTTSYRSGDGQEATGSEATFTYDEAGTYTITLGPASIAATLPLDIVLEWWAADTVFSNNATNDTEPLNRFAMTAAHFQDDQGAFLSAFDGLQELCDLFGADFQQVPRPDQGPSWLFRQRSVFAGSESPVVELSYVAITTDQDQPVTTQVVDESGRVTTFSTDGFADVEGDEATFLFATPDQYEITLARELDPDVQVWRYEDNVLTEDSPFTRVFGLDTNAWAFDFQHTEQYERRLSSVVGIYHHEDLESIFVGGDFEDETTGDWIKTDYSGLGVQEPSREVVTLDSESRTPDSTQENEFAFRTQWAFELPDPDIYPLLTQSRTLPESTQRTFRVAHEGIIEQVEGRETERYIVTVGPLSLVSPPIGLDSEFETVKGDGVTYHLTDELPYPLPVGTKVPIVTFDDQDPPGSVVLTERAEAGDTTLTGDGDVTVREEDFEDTGAADWFPPRVQVFEWTDDPGAISPFFDEPGINTAFHKDAARDAYGDVEMIAPAPPSAGEVEVSYAWRPVEVAGPTPPPWRIVADATIDNLQVGFPGAPDKTVSVAATDFQGDSLDISVSSGSGPLRDSPRRLLWMREKIVGFTALRVDRILIGTAFGDSGPLLSEAQALERLKQYNEHTRMLSLTTRRRLGERLIGGDEIIEYDGRLWTVQRVVTQGRSQELTLVAIQEDTLPTTTITRLTDDVDAVRIDEEIDYASRR